MPTTMKFILTEKISNLLLVFVIGFLIFLYDLKPPEGLYDLATSMRFHIILMMIAWIPLAIILDQVMLIEDLYEKYLPETDNFIKKLFKHIILGLCILIAEALLILFVSAISFIVISEELFRTIAEYF